MTSTVTDRQLKRRIREIFIDHSAEKYFIVDDNYSGEGESDFHKVCNHFHLDDYKVFWEDSFRNAFMGWYKHKQKGINTQFLDANSICKILKL